MSNGGAPPDARIAHQIPGRLRLQIVAVRGDLPQLVRVATGVQRIPAVRWVDLSPRSGSLVIYYREGAGDLPRELTRLGERERLFRLSASRAAEGWRASAAQPLSQEAGSQLAHDIVEVLRRLDRALIVATDHRIDLRVLPSVGSLLAAALSSTRMRSTPWWWSLVVFAFHSFEVLHRDVEFGEPAGLSDEDEDEGD